MFCFITSGPAGAKTWDIRRSIEVLAFQRQPSRVSILFVTLAENRLPGNSLRLLHRGRPECRIVPSWPLPLHPFEREGSKGVLSRIYGNLFAGDAPERRFDLLPWDEQVAVEPCPLLVTREARRLDPDPGECEGPDEVFSTWTVGPLDIGWHLLAFEVAFNRTTRGNLSPEGRPFSVDGADKVLARIMYGDVANLPIAQRERWLQRLAPFTDPATRLDPTSYDVILLGQPPASCVALDSSWCASGVYRGKRQAPGADRYLTTDPGFTLPLAFVEAKSDPPVRRLPQEVTL